MKKNLPAFLIIGLTLNCIFSSSVFAASYLQKKPLLSYDDNVGGAGAGGGIDRIVFFSSSSYSLYNGYRASRSLSVSSVNGIIKAGQYIQVNVQMNQSFEIVISDNRGFIRERKVIDTSKTNGLLRIDISNLPKDEYNIELKNKDTSEAFYGSFIMD